MNDIDRWEHLTASQGAPVRDEDEHLREAWMALSKELSQPLNAVAADPDDMFAEIVRKERQLRSDVVVRRFGLAAAALVFVGVVSWAVWSARFGEGPAPMADRAPTITQVEAAPWNDGWDEAAFDVETALAASAESLRMPTETWIDEQILRLMDECVRVWQTL